MINLTQAERDKFAVYLQQECETIKGLVQQMIEQDTPGVFVKKYRAEHMACEIVHGLLVEGEEQEVGG